MSLRYLTNPITQREVRAYQRTASTLLRFIDTPGIVIGTLALSVYLIISWLVDRAALPVGLYYYQQVRPEIHVTIQLAVGIIFLGAILRCTAGGAAAARRYGEPPGEAILLTGITHQRLIVGHWIAALHQVKGWMLALGLIRITAAVVMAAEYQFNSYWNDLAQVSGAISVCCNGLESANSAIHGFQFPLAFAFAISLSLIEIWASTGLGLALGLWLRPVSLAWAAAVVLRVLPMLVFSEFPKIASHGNPFDWIELRWVEYTWFAFVDGGTTAMLRMSRPIFEWGFSGWVARAWLAFFAAFHLLLIYGLAAYGAARWRLKRLGASSDDSSVPIHTEPGDAAVRRSENVLVMVSSLVFVVCIGWQWIHAVRAIPIVGQTMHYNLPILAALRQSIFLLVGLATVRGLFAGVRRGRLSREDVKLPALSTRVIWSSTWSVVKEMRVWIECLAFVLMMGFMLLIAEHLVSFYSVRIQDCVSQSQAMWCGNRYLGWQVSQWVLGVGMAVVLSGVAIFSSVLLGFGIGRAVKSQWLGLSLAVGLRMIPLVLALMPPDAQFVENGWGSSAGIYWQQDPWVLFADSGISALFQMAEPFWHTGHEHGLTNIGLSVLYLTLGLWMFVAYAVLGGILARRARQEKHTG